MRTLIVAPFAPYRDGIAAYAVQQAKQLQAQGDEVEVFSPLPSGAAHHGNLQTVRGITALTRIASEFDRVILHFFPELIFASGSARHRMTQLAGLRSLATRAPLELRIHEVEFDWYERRRPPREVLASTLAACRSVSVHTEHERHRLAEVFGLDLATIEIVDHGAAFVKAFEGDRERARALLSLDQDRHIFLCIGFLQAHKGFDRAIRAFAEMAPANAELHVVGSARVDAQDILDHIDLLQHLCDTTPNATLHVEFTGDRRFDAWIAAADTVVLPYRSIWSSGVIERADLYDTPVIATNVGGLADQAEHHLVVANDHELRRAMAQRLGAFDDATPPISSGRSQAELQSAIDEWERLATGTIAVGPSRAVRSLEPIHVAPTTSHRLPVRIMKRVIAPLIHWQTAPLARSVEELRLATAEAIDELSAGELPEERSSDD